MGFNEMPFVDRSAGNEERSVQKLKSLLNIQSGFILREDIPDYGCDFDAELILEGGQASNQRFPIQLKSVGNLKTIEGDKYISYSFETSRLGYLMRRMPAGGIIVIYSVEQDECFFDYCDRLYERIMEERQSRNWFENEQIKIHIPVLNKLTGTLASDLHHTFKNRFTQAAIMQNSIGRRYGLPSVISENDSKYDFNNVEHVKEFLKEHGLLLLNSYDLHITFNMISQVPLPEIYHNKDLLLMAAVSYGEMGMNAESKLFVLKLQKYELSQEIKFMLRFVEMKNDLALGYLDTNKFIEGLEELLGKDMYDENKITVEINLIHFKLAQKQALEPLPSNLLQQINNVFTKIKQLSLSNRRGEFLLLWNCENLSFLITTINADAISDFAIRESLKDAVASSERVDAATQLIELETKLNDMLNLLNRKAVANSDKVLNAHVFSLDVKHYLFSQINYVSFGVPINTMEGFAKRLLTKIAIAENAFNTFAKVEMYNYAYDNLCNMIDLIELAEGYYKVKTPYNKNELYNIKEKMEGLPLELSRSLIFPALLFRKKLQHENLERGKTSFLKDLNDLQIETLARNLLKSMNLPEDRLQYILHEMNAHSLFDKRCSDPNIDFVQDESPFHVYTKNHRFILRNKKSGIISLPSSDMDALLKAWGF